MDRILIEEKIENAKSQIEEIRQNRLKYQETLRQLDMNESGWRGFIEALSIVLSDLDRSEDS